MTAWVSAEFPIEVERLHQLLHDLHDLGQEHSLPDRRFLLVIQGDVLLNGDLHQLGDIIDLLVLQQVVALGRKSRWISSGARSCRL